MTVEIWFDFVCPFCYIGEAKFHKALEAFAHRDDVTLEFKSYQLSMSSEQTKGKDIHQVVADKYHISYAQAKANNDRIAQAANEVGLHFDFDRAKLNSTALAHEIIQYAKRFKKEQGLIRRFFKAFFEDGIDIGDEAGLMQLADEAGLNLPDLRQAMASGELKAAVQRDEKEAFDLGIHSIPHFIIDRKYTVSGARDPQDFLKALQAAQA